MTGKHSNWVRVSTANPCPICDKPDNCEVSQDGVMVWCGRVSEGSLRQNGGGQFLHRLTENSHRPACPPPRPTKPSGPKRDFAKLADQWFALPHAIEARLELAKKLGVSVASLESLRVGWNPATRLWSFPERSATGAVIGINTRSERGDKKRLKGCNSGLTYADGWGESQGPIYLVEGGSDTAALLTIGLPVVGRPSNRGGVGFLRELLYYVPPEREIIVIGERDQKEDGKWPGREGAIATATRLAEELERPFAWSLPPDDAKDVRAWLQTAPQIPSNQLAELFASGLLKQWVSPPPCVVCPVNTAPVVSLDGWRSEMLTVRMESLTKPGVYLDASTTGAGKTHVDLQVVQAIQKQGGT